MIKKAAVLVLLVVMSVCATAYAYDGKRKCDGPPRHALLEQLPADKEMLFHQTMRQVKEQTAHIRQEMKDVKAEMRDILTAPEFNESLFVEKTKSLQGLRNMMKEAMEEAIVKLAKQFTQEERKILAELIPQKPRRHGGSPSR